MSLHMTDKLSQDKRTVALQHQEHSNTPILVYAANFTPAVNSASTAVYRQGWQAILQATTPLVQRSAAQQTMLAAYNHLLALYHTGGSAKHGGAIVQRAAAAAKQADPCAWVVRLLAGFAAADPSIAPSVALCSKQEAMVS